MWRPASAGRWVVRVNELLERTAARHPDKTAIVCAGERRSYSWIDREASAGARRLREGGLRAGDRVALVLDNSIDAVIWIFAVLKAGGVFFIAKPHTSPERLNELLTDSA